MEYLSLEIFDLDGKGGSKYATLPEDASISITETSEIFASGDVWSHSFTLNVRVNAHIFGTSGEIHGNRLHEQIDKRKACLWVEGVLLYTGLLHLDDEVDVDSNGNVTISLDAGNKTFEDKIEGGKANQVPLMGDVLIGMAHWPHRSVYEALAGQTSAYIQCRTPVVYDPTDDYHIPHENNKYVYPYINNKGKAKTKDGTPYMDFTFEEAEFDNGNYPHLVYPKGLFFGITNRRIVEDIDCVNTDYPYDDDHPYCNVALCYQKYGYPNNDYTQTPEAQRSYDVIPAHSVNAAPNFYVIYWLRSLFKYLGIDFDYSSLMAVEDFRRLFMVNTRCAHEEAKMTDFNSETEWSDRFGGYLSGTMTIPEKVIGGYSCNPSDSKLYMDSVEISAPRISSIINNSKGFLPNDVMGELSPSIRVEDIWFTPLHIDWWTDPDKSQNQYEYTKANNKFYKAYATNECFPNVDIKEIIDALDGGFGLKFFFDKSFKRCRAVFLRDLFLDKDIQEVTCDIMPEVKEENNIRGFRLTYGQGKDDTQFYYKGFADIFRHKPEQWKDTSDNHDYSHWNTDVDYRYIIEHVAAFNNTCYVTPNTGNAYIYKVDEDAKRYEELHPATFECAGFMDAEDGDCTGEAETIKEISAGFTPAIMNDINIADELTNGTTNQRFALYVGETMKPRRPDLGSDGAYPVDDSRHEYNVNKLYDDYPNAKVDGLVQPGLFRVSTDIKFDDSTLTNTTISADLYVNTYSQYRNKYGYFDVVGIAKVVVDWDVVFKASGYVNCVYNLYLQDNYAPTDDGLSPIEKHDWGLTLGIMRGSGSDATTKYEFDYLENEGNDTWELTPGSSATAHHDTCDNYGREWDYNGDGEGVGNRDGRFSLKLRASKPNPYFDPTKEEDATNRRYLEITNPNLKERGLADQFYKEYSYWVRNGRIAKLTVHMELSQLITLDKTKRVKIGNIIGFIKKMEYTISNKTGLSNVTLEIMYI